MNAMAVRLLLVVAALGLAASGYTWWRNSEREVGRNEVRAEQRANDLQAAELRASDSRQQRQFNDLASGKHVAVVDKLNNQLGNARVQISKLSGRTCLDGATVRMLNTIGTTGGEPGGATASEPAQAAPAAATDRDVGNAIATCRAWYAEVSSQLNAILDIEDRRHPP